MVAMILCMHSDYGVCDLHLLSSVIYVFYNNNNNMKSYIIGLSRNATPSALHQYKTHTNNKYMENTCTIH